jgi:hypothetical protein
MRRLAVVLALLALAAPARSETLQAQTKAWDVAPGVRFHLEFPVGHLRIEATNDSRVRLELQVRCDHGSPARCAERAKDLRLQVDQDSKSLRVAIKGYPRFSSNGFHVDGTLLVPKALESRIEMGVGELEMDGLAGNLDVDLGVGEATLRLDEVSFGSADVEVGVGDASLRSKAGVRHSSGFISRTVRWNDGEGPSHVSLHVGVGDARVRME